MAHIGKNVIENLTTAMYENSLTVFREYVQNSADSIDRAVHTLGIMQKGDAVIEINIDALKRRITIFDNAAGIARDEFRETLSVIADSKKDPKKDKGFRGIGRLAGLAYCDKLIFRTSAKGEPVESIMYWNGKKLRDTLSDPNKRPTASKLIDDVINVEEKKCDKDAHFFEVIMDDVIMESDDLLDIADVKKYLQAVAPVPYKNSFIFRDKIYEHARQIDFDIDEYEIQVNGEILFKLYGTSLYEGNGDAKKKYEEVTDVDFRDFYSKEKLIGWMWYGVTGYQKQLPAINTMRGIRLRKENIQIGSEETLSYPKFYKEPRGSYYFIGELFVVDDELRPNARRDYFNKNQALIEFEEKVIPVLHDEFYNLYHYANKVKNSIKRLSEYNKLKAEYDRKSNNVGFLDKEEQVAEEKKLNEEKEKAEKAEKEIEKRRKDAEADEVLKRVFKSIEKEFTIEPSNDENNVVSQQEQKVQKYLTQALSKYNKREQKLITRIYGILKAILPKDMADTIIEKIQEELAK